MCITYPDSNHELTLKVLQDIIKVCQPHVDISNGNDTSPLRQVFLSASFLYSQLLLTS